MPSENQIAQMKAARELSMKNSTCYPNDNTSMPSTAVEPGSEKSKESNDGGMYGR